MTLPVPSHGTVAERIRVVRNHLAPSELAVASAIIEGYPTSGLVPIAQIAAEAQVSGPTVLRLVNKLGFDGYAEVMAATSEATEPATVVGLVDQQACSGHQTGTRVGSSLAAM